MQQERNPSIQSETTLCLSSEENVYDAALSLMNTIGFSPEFALKDLNLILSKAWRKQSTYGNEVCEEWLIMDDESDEYQNKLKRDAQELI